MVQEKTDLLNGSQQIHIHTLCVERQETKILYALMWEEKMW